MTTRFGIVLVLVGCASGSSRDLRESHDPVSLVVSTAPASASASGTTVGSGSAVGPTRPRCLGPTPVPPEHLKNVDQPSTERAELVFRVHRDLPIRCNAKQTNTPCVYESGKQCLLRSANCTGMPCSEGPHPPIDCSCSTPGLSAPRRVCLVLTGVEPGAPVRVFQEDQFSESGAAADADGRLQMCSQSERPYWIEVDDRPHGRAAVTVDWSNGDCVTYDVASHVLKPSCDKPAPKIFENRF